MIVREEGEHFILISQPDHALLSGECLMHLEEVYWGDIVYKDSVIYAAYQHDCGWQAFDQQPFWNDRTNHPYSFIDFPNIPKIVLYTQGIQKIQKKDDYAALLCSKHYQRFLATASFPEARSFVLQEAQRQEQLINNLTYFDHDQLEADFSLLQFSDMLSLFVCMNRPGTTDDHIHSFFKGGISIAVSAVSHFPAKYAISWQDAEHIVMNPFPFSRAFSITLKQKRIAKTDIQQQGLLKAYEQAPLTEQTIWITPMDRSVAIS
ncbi:DUF3891 family protein [Gracilibacillus alcaliphilus]|uniref:DUF3891 family protein n=1 Tax=Gracilibacillus alcaliphilus TaxID=1401441 RepID=UPI001956A778|nr:DUF3891 family protein [Gracilibacillus alcaliphilus]MBM7675644.1 hypothetical protein [Gracilibacillus alcaliphilus]